MKTLTALLFFLFAVAVPAQIETPPPIPGVGVMDSLSVWADTDGLYKRNGSFWQWREGEEGRWECTVDLWASKETEIEKQVVYSFTAIFVWSGEPHAGSRDLAVASLVQMVYPICGDRGIATVKPWITKNLGKHGVTMDLNGARYELARAVPTAVALTVRAAK